MKKVTAFFDLIKSYSIIMLVRTEGTLFNEVTSSEKPQMNWIKGISREEWEIVMEGKFGRGSGSEDESDIHG